MEVLFPKDKNGKVYETTTSYENWIARNNDSEEGFIMRFQNWRGAAEEVFTKVISNDAGLMSGVKLAKKLLSGMYKSDKHSYALNSIGIASGVYFYRMMADNYISTKK